MTVLRSGNKYAHVLLPNGEVVMLPLGQVAHLLVEYDKEAL